MKKEEFEAMRNAEEVTAAMLVNFAKSGRSSLNEDEERMIEECFETTGSNGGHFPGLSRRVECWSILLYCINPCDNYELRRIQDILLEQAAKVDR